MVVDVSTVFGGGGGGGDIIDYTYSNMIMPQYLMTLSSLGMNIMRIWRISTLCGELTDFI